MESGELWASTSHLQKPCSNSTVMNRQPWNGIRTLFLPFEFSWYSNWPAFGRSLIPTSIRNEQLPFERAMLSLCLQYLAALPQCPEALQLDKLLLRISSMVKGYGS